MATVFPPLLPSVFVVSVGISANRLHAKRISCTNPEGILVAGKVSDSRCESLSSIISEGLTQSFVRWMRPSLTKRER